MTVFPAAYHQNAIYTGHGIVHRSLRIWKSLARPEKQVISIVLMQTFDIDKR